MHMCSSNFTSMALWFQKDASGRKLLLTTMAQFGGGQLWTRTPIRKSAAHLRLASSSFNLSKDKRKGTC